MLPPQPQRPVWATTCRDCTLIIQGNLKNAAIAAACLGVTILLQSAPLQALPVAVQDAAWSHLPAPAWVQVDMAWVREFPKMNSRLSGSLRRGDQVLVTGCTPDCQQPHAWALLGTDGAVPLKILHTLPVPDQALSTSSAALYIYGKLPHPASPVFAQASSKSKVLRREKAEFRVAFTANPQAQAQGWLQRPDGGWMRTQDVILFTPSEFEGIHDPHDRAFVFVRRKVKLHQADNQGPDVGYARYTTLPLLGEKAGKALVPNGWLPRSLVRVVRTYARPGTVKPKDRWIHIDLTEQVLTAYQGDRMVFATLVSTGKSGRKSTRTHEGTFRIYAKSVHTNMRGKPWDDYFAEGVPHAMHFDGGRALHGAYWHDQFGIEKSHGCVNLSPKDAAWLFEWVPPSMPAGWTEFLPLPGKNPSVVVQVDKKGKVAPSNLSQGQPQAQLQQVVEAREPRDQRYGPNAPYHRPIARNHSHL